MRIAAVNKFIGWIAVLLFLVLGAAVPAQDTAASAISETCGGRPITIARMQWPSAAVLAHIHALILSQNLGCAVQVVAGDLGATTSSLATTGSPDVAPELWLGRVAAVWNSAIAGQQVRPAAPTFTGGPLESWFVPDYVIQNNPGLKSVRDLPAHWKVFAAPGADRASFLSCPSDWACALINANLMRALKMDQRFDIVEPDDRYALDRAIGEAVSRHQPALFYYWQPNAIVSQLHLVPLDMGPFDAQAIACLASRECGTPQASSFAGEQVVIAVSERVFRDAPKIAGYFQRATMPLDTMNQLLAWQSAQDASAEDTAAQFVAENKDIWQAWLGQ